MKKELMVVSGALLLLTGVAVQAMPITDGKVKWSQLPDTVNPLDTLSMHRSNGPVVADDFVSNGKEIIGFHWWGSYFQDTGQGPERNVRFEISFHENCPAGSADPGCVDPNTGQPYPYSTPKDRSVGATPDDYFSDIFVAEEDFFGTFTDAQGVSVDIYEYWARVDPNNGPSFLGGTWNEVAGETYWLDIAWDAGQFGTNINDDVWGWARADNGGVCILDCAVQTSPPSPGSNPHLGPWALLADTDMAFEVIGVPAPATVALLGLGLLGAGFARRGRTA